MARAPAGPPLGAGAAGGGGGACPPRPRAPPPPGRNFPLRSSCPPPPRRTFTRTKLMDEFWDFDSSATSRTVDVYMSKLREKTAHCTGFEIVTVHGLGYKLVLK